MSDLIPVTLEQLVIGDDVIYTEPLQPCGELGQPPDRSGPYNLMPTKCYDRSKTKYENLLNYNESGGETAHRTPPFVQLKYHTSRMRGCSHYISGVELQCSVCGGRHKCARCHDEAADHTFQFGAMLCACCSSPCQISENVPRHCVTCGACGAELYNYVCRICAIFCIISWQASPYYHCAHCRRCELGIESRKKHCTKCGRCFTSYRFDSHRCQQDLGTCPICQETLNSSRDGRVLLLCGHSLHKDCRLQMIRSDNFRCPSCRVLVVTGSMREAYENFYKEKYLSEIVPPIWENKFVYVLCNECGNQFLAHQHPIGYRCTNPICLTFNTTQQVSYTGPVDEAKRIIDVQDTILRDNFIEVLKPIFNDMEFYKQFFIMRFEAELTLRRGDDESLFDCLLRLLGLASRSREQQLVLLNKLLRQYQSGMDIEQAWSIVQCSDIGL